MASRINTYSFFQVSEIIIVEIKKEFVISEFWISALFLISELINYCGYPKLLFHMSEIIILDSQNK